MEQGLSFEQLSQLFPEPGLHFASAAVAPREIRNERERAGAQRGERRAVEAAERKLDLLVPGRVLELRRLLKAEGR